MKPVQAIEEALDLMDDVLYRAMCEADRKGGLHHLDADSLGLASAMVKEGVFPKAMKAAKQRAETGT